MRVRIGTIVFAGSALSALLGAVAMGLAMWIAQREGFSHYLATRDAERLDQLVRRFDEEAVARGGIAAFRAGRFTLGEAFGALGPPPITGHVSPEGDRSPPRGRPPPSEDIGGRLVLFDASGARLSGPERPPVLPGMAGRPPPPRIEHRTLTVEGVQVGTIAMLPRVPANGDVEARFLQSQVRYGLLAFLVAVLLCLYPSWLVGRAGARAAGRFARRTAAIAAGDYYRYDRKPSFVVELDAVGLDLSRMAGSLQRMESARRRWLAEIAHELRTPLAVLRGEIEALRDGIRQPGRAEIDSLLAEAGSLGRLVDDLHFLSVSELEGMACHFEQVDPAEICGLALRRAQILSKAEGLSFALSVSGNGVGTAWWDRDRIDQLLANLLANACRYTDRPGKIEMLLHAEHDGLRIVIDDTPPGVDPAHLPHLFEPLYRADPSRSRASGGSGLGLSVCATIVEAHGGAIAAGSSPLGGLRVTVDLPRRSAA